MRVARIDCRGGAIAAALFMAAGGLGGHVALAHVVAGARVFPVTLTFDDPGVSDEASLPSVAYSRGGSSGAAGPSHTVNVGWEYDKTIADATAIILNDGSNVQQGNGAKTQSGWRNLVVTGKWQLTRTTTMNSLSPSVSSARSVAPHHS